MGFFENRYKKLCPDFKTTFTKRKAFRVNTLKIKGDVLADRLKKNKVKCEKIPYLSEGYHYTASFSLGATPEYLLGYYYLQGAASQVVAEVLAPKKTDQVLDMAAAPGSKTTHLAMLMQNKGRIFALDNNTHRLASLRNNCERLLVKNVLFFKKDARFVTDLKEKFDRVLLDAPCSGNFCGEEKASNWFAKRQIDDIKANSRVQKELLKAAVTVLKPGGTLVYSTCSLEPEEDELLIDWALKKFDLQLQKIDLPIGDAGVTSWDGKDLDSSLALTKRFWPHKTQTEGFFIAKLTKGS